MKPQLKSCGNSETTVALAWEIPENPRHQLKWLNPLLIHTSWETLETQAKQKI